MTPKLQLNPGVIEHVSGPDNTLQDGLRRAHVQSLEVFQERAHPCQDGGGLDDPDIDGLAVSLGQPKTIPATTPPKIFARGDAGESWWRLGIMQQFRHPYILAIAVKEDNPQGIFVGHG